jgi:UDPglucose 6-dehydrogenase
MKICVLGTGYVGLVSAVCLAELGHQVVGVDVDGEKITKLKQGISPIYEPGLEELLQKNIQADRLFFSEDLSFGLQNASVVLSAVGTPPDERRRVDLCYARQVAEAVGKQLDHYIVFVNKSTVPAGTAETMKNIIKSNLRQALEFDVASNPEFLREGSAIADFMEPDRIIVGVESAQAKKVLKELYQPLIAKGVKFMATDIKSAELIKYASNAFLATKISFINEVANLCDSIKADVKDVAQGMGLDTRINHKFLEAGPGFGGSCFPKDVDEFIRTASDYGIEMRILEAVVKTNQFQRSVVIQKLQKHLPDLNNKTIAIWGLAFKPETDDVREAASLDIIKTLVQKGVKIKAYDPLANKNARQLLNLDKEEGDRVKIVDDKFLALQGADALILMTHWEEFRGVSAKEIKKYLNIVIDARNFWERQDFENLNMIYEGMGR